MRVILGMIVGAALTVAVAFLHDSMATSSVAAGANASKVQTLVNWKVVQSNMHQLVADLRVVNERVRENWTKFTDRI